MHLDRKVSYFSIPHSENAIGVRSGDLSGHSMVPSLQKSIHDRFHLESLLQWPSQEGTLHIVAITVIKLKFKLDSNN